MKAELVKCNIRSINQQIRGFYDNYCEHQVISYNTDQLVFDKFCETHDHIIFASEVKSNPMILSFTKQLTYHFG